VLRIVGLFPGRPAGELARILHIHPSTLTVLAQRLIGQGLLRRTEGVEDRRRVTYSLTARGARINATHEGTVESAVEAALRGVTAEQRAATRHVLLRIADHLQAYPEPAPPRRARQSSSRRSSGTKR
jgi:DNA-binding MarR family transcriptional regulator